MDIQIRAVVKKDLKGRVLHRGKSPTVVMEEVLQNEMKFDLAYIKNRLSASSPSTGYIATRSGKLLKGTRLEVTRTAKGNVTGRIVIGEGVPYTGLHVGVGSPGVYMTKKKMFTIPFSWNQNADGSWKAPFVPGQLHSVKGLFRGTAERNLKEDTLYYKIGKRIKPVFKLKDSIKLPQRVNLDEIMEGRRDQLMGALAEAFSGYDFGYLAQQIRGGTIE